MGRYDHLPHIYVSGLCQKVDPLLVIFQVREYRELVWVNAPLKSKWDFCMVTAFMLAWSIRINFSLVVEEQYKSLCYTSLAQEVEQGMMMMQILEGYAPSRNVNLKPNSSLASMRHTNEKEQNGDNWKKIS